MRKSAEKKKKKTKILQIFFSEQKQKDYKKERPQAAASLSPLYR